MENLTKIVEQAKSGIT